LTIRKGKWTLFNPWPSFPPRSRRRARRTTQRQRAAAADSRDSQSRLNVTNDGLSVLSSKEYDSGFFVAIVSIGPPLRATRVSFNQPITHWDCESPAATTCECPTRCPCEPEKICTPPGTLNSRARVRTLVRKYETKTHSSRQAPVCRRVAQAAARKVDSISPGRSETPDDQRRGGKRRAWAAGKSPLATRSLNATAGDMLTTQAAR